MPKEKKETVSVIFKFDKHGMIAGRLKKDGVWKRFKARVGNNEDE
jgi:uncharacterized GH25 family protein